MMPSRSKAGPASRDVRGRVRRRARLRKPAAQNLVPAGECVCSFGATRVGSMIKRVRLHVTTDRFLAGLRGDKMWEAGLRLCRGGSGAARVAAAAGNSQRVDLSDRWRGATLDVARISAQRGGQSHWRTPMKPGVAFDVCHEVYAAAREIVNTRMPTLQMDRASKFLWRPDLRPRMVEYLADFALAGARALGDDQPHTRIRRARRRTDFRASCARSGGRGAGAGNCAPAGWCCFASTILAAPSIRRRGACWA